MDYELRVVAWVASTSFSLGLLSGAALSGWAYYRPGLADPGPRPLRPAVGRGLRASARPRYGWRLVAPDCVEFDSAAAFLIATGQPVPGDDLFEFDAT